MAGLCWELYLYTDLSESLPQAHLQITGYKLTCLRSHSQDSDSSLSYRKACVFSIAPGCKRIVKIEGRAIFTMRLMYQLIILESILFCSHIYAKSLSKHILPIGFKANYSQLNFMDHCYYHKIIITEELLYNFRSALKT